MSGTLTIENNIRCRASKSTCVVVVRGWHSIVVVDRKLWLCSRSWTRRRRYDGVEVLRTLNFWVTRFKLHSFHFSVYSITRLPEVQAAGIFLSTKLLINVDVSTYRVGISVIWFIVPVLLLNILVFADGPAWRLLYAHRVVHRGGCSV